MNGMRWNSNMMDGMRWNSNMIFLVYKTILLLLKLEWLNIKTFIIKLKVKKIDMEGNNTHDTLFSLVAK